MPVRTVVTRLTEGWRSKVASARAGKPPLVHASRRRASLGEAAGEEVCSGSRDRLMVGGAMPPVSGLGSIMEAAAEANKVPTSAPMTMATKWPGRAGITLLI
jgi:hypothetical protein